MPSLLKRAEIYPDSTGGSDQITFSYNRQSQVTTMVDQGGTTHAYDYDKLGRQTQDRVTALGTDVDGAVRRIASTYEVRGMRQLLTSHDNASVGSGSVLNQSRFVYNDFSQLITEYQAHEGSVNTSTTAKVQYTYASGSSNTIRATGMVYPSGRVLTYSYGSTGGQSDRLSRVASYIDDDGTSHIIDYTFLGAGTFVESDRPQPSLKWSIITDQGGTDPNTGDIYRGLDRFGRVKDNQWFGYGTGSNVDVDRIRYGYDRAGNRIWRENPVATSYGKEFDEIYSYDALHRLKDMARGRLNTAKTALTSTTFAQCWTLDATGNWSGFREDDTGNGTWDRVQSRTANGVNEIANISASVGPTPITPTYSPAGNMTTIPTTGGLDWNNFTLAEWDNFNLNQWDNFVLDSDGGPYACHLATYDAWNRLVKLVGQPGNQTVAEYAYDGAKRQIRQKNYAAGTLTETRHLYYTDPASWRCLEERLGTTPDTAAPDRQFVWGSRYIDDLILRDRAVTSSSSSSSGGGPNPLGERSFACQDGNWNVTALLPCTPPSQAHSRIVYSAYGDAALLNHAYEHTSPVPCEYTFAGYRRLIGTVLSGARFRLLCSSIGGWITRDADPATASHFTYLYVYGDPLAYTDAMGRDGLLASYPSTACRTYNCHSPQTPQSSGLSGPSLSLLGMGKPACPYWISGPKVSPVAISVSNMEVYGEKLYPLDRSNPTAAINNPFLLLARARTGFRYTRNITVRVTLKACCCDGSVSEIDTVVSFSQQITTSISSRSELGFLALRTQLAPRWFNGVMTAGNFGQFRSFVNDSVDQALMKALGIEHGLSDSLSVICSSRRSILGNIAVDVGSLPPIDLNSPPLGAGGSWADALWGDGDGWAPVPGEIEVPVDGFLGIP